MRCGYQCTHAISPLTPPYHCPSCIAVPQSLRSSVRPCVLYPWVNDCFTFSGEWGTVDRRKSSTPSGVLVLVGDSPRERYRSAETTRWDRRRSGCCLSPRCCCSTSFRSGRRVSCRDVSPSSPSVPSRPPRSVGVVLGRRACWVSDSAALPSVPSSSCSVFSSCVCVLGWPGMGGGVCVCVCSGGRGGRLPFGPVAPSS